MKKINNITLYETFSHIIHKSHILFSDIEVNYASSDMLEIYGVSKDSGISYLMNEFNMPCLLNSEFSNISQLERGSLYFKDYEELVKIYKKTKDRKYYLSLVSKIIKDTRNYTIEYYAKKIKENF